MKKREGTAIVGIDEVGRGPLAGPVAVGAVWFPADFDRGLLAGVRDSKKLSQERREEWAARARKWEHAGLLRTAVVMASAQTIDATGLSRVMARLVTRAVRKLAPDPHDEGTRVRVLLDGSLYAPSEYVQETIIHGDDLRPEISLASIIAKVRRDRLMVRLAARFPEYGFDQHKGYGTRAHLEAIARHGLCAIHRKSFCKNINGMV